MMRGEKQEKWAIPAKSKMEKCQKNFEKKRFSLLKKKSRSCIIHLLSV
jgi:hypothetical protein